MDRQNSCKERINENLKSRIFDLGKMWLAYKDGDEDKYIDEIGNISEYGLSFDYVEPNTFKDQKEGYYSYQLSCGGPSDEFRFYVNLDLSLYKIEYYFLDWFDGANKKLNGKTFNLLSEIFEHFKECGALVKERK